MTSRNGRQRRISEAPADMHQDGNYRIALESIYEQPRQQRSMPKINGSFDTKTFLRHPSKERQRLLMEHLNVQKAQLSLGECQLPSPCQELRVGNSCQNHQDKTAKYLVAVGEQQLTYCQRCAIYLASKGFLVERIERQASTERIPRQLVVQELSNELQQFIRAVDQQEGSTEPEHAQIHGKYFEIKQWVEDSYRLLLELAGDFRERALSSAEEHHRRVIEVGEHRKQQFHRWLKDCREMRNDIAEATESIRLASEEDFRQVVELYQEKLADFNIQFRLMNRFQPQQWQRVDVCAIVDQLAHNFKRRRELAQQHRASCQQSISTITKHQDNKSIRLDSNDSVVVCLLGNNQLPGTASLALSSSGKLRA